MKTHDQDFRTLAVDTIRESLHNPRQREDQTALGELTESVRSRGVLVPILVRMVDGDPEVVYGHRRLHAARAAGLETIPAIVRELTDEEALEVAVIENCTRVDIDPLDEADAYKALLEQGKLGVEDLAAKVGKSKSHVYARLRLTELAPPVRKALVDDVLTVGAALLFARLTPARQVAAFKEVTKRHGHDAQLTASSIRYDLGRFNHALNDAPFAVKDLTLLAAVGPCTHCPKRSGAQHDLWGNPDGEAEDLCTDPDCWDHKVANDWARREESAAADGVTILAAKDVFDQRGGMDRAYVVARDTPYEAHRLPRSKTWRQLVGKALKPSIVQHPETGATVEVYEAKAARKAIPDDIREVLFGRDTPASSARSSPTKHDPVDRRKLNAMVDQRFGAAVVAAASKLTDTEALRLVATDLVGGYDADEAMVAVGWDPKAKVKPEARIKAASPEEIRSYVIVSNVLAGYGLDRPVLGVDRGVITKAVEKELREQAKAETKVKKAAKKTKGRAAKATKGAKAKPGTCRICECTEQDACEGGCGWVDETKTLCTRCTEG